jgi:hypothetical protein
VSDMEDKSEAFFTCKGCGAKMTYAPGMQSLKCEFCGTISQLTADYNHLPGGAEVDMIVPMTVDQRLLEFAAYEVMAAGRYTPDDMIETCRFVRFERLYVPSFVFTGQYDGTWTASFGYNRSETYTDWEDNGQGGRRPVTRTRTVVDWSPATGDVRGGFCFAAYAGSKLPANVALAIERSEKLTDATSDVSSYIAGIEVEAYETTERDAFSTRVKARVDELVERDVRSKAQGDHQRDWNWSSTFSHNSATALLPVCHTVLEYQGNEYQVWSDGADVSRLVADKFPEDRERKRAVAFAFVPFVISAAVAGVAALIIQDSRPTSTELYWVLAGIVLSALGFGFSRRNALLDHSRRMRETILSFHKASLGNMQSLSESERTTLLSSFERPKRTWLSQTANQPVAVVALMTSLASVGAGVIGVGSGKGSIVTNNNYNSSKPAVVSRPTTLPPAANPYTAPPRPTYSSPPRGTLPNSAVTASEPLIRPTAPAQPMLPEPNTSTGGPARPAPPRTASIEPSSSPSSSGINQPITAPNSSAAPQPPSTYSAPPTQPAEVPRPPSGSVEATKPPAAAPPPATYSALPSSTETATPPTARPPIAPPTPMSQEENARQFANRYWETYGSSKSVEELAGMYAPEVSYFGQRKSAPEVLKEKAAFFKRWPERKYTLNGAPSTSCTNESCRISGALQWDMGSLARNSYSQGSATFQLMLNMRKVPPVITSEESTVTSRNLTAYHPLPRGNQDGGRPIEATDSPAPKCDELAGNPADKNRAPGSVGAKFEDLKRQASQAVDVCARAAELFPKELRYKYQYARALSFSDPDRAATLHRELVGQGYVAAYDNLASLLTRDPKRVPEAITLFHRGAELGDPDAMVSLADLIEKGYLPVNNGPMMRMALLSQAARLGHEGAKRELSRLQGQSGLRLSDQDQKVILNMFQGFIGAIAR